jgi:hypothetical protein
MLTSGMVPALYADDEKEAILSGVIIYMSHWSFVTKIFYNDYPGHGGNCIIFKVMTST